MIIKIKKPRQYEVIPTSTLRDNRLQLDELGLLCRLLSRPDGWEVRPRALQNETGWGRERLRRVLTSLESHGYLQRVRSHDKKTGNWIWQSEIYAEAQPENFYHCRVTRPMGGPSMGDPSMGDPSDGEPDDIISKDSSQYRSKSIPPPKPGQDQNQGGGEMTHVHFQLQDQDRFEDEEEEYVGLVMSHRSPDDPESYEQSLRARLKHQGGLSDRDRRQLEGWRAGQQIDLNNCSNDTAGLAALAALKKTGDKNYGF